ncbi:MAG: TonB-dependent receptor, partial [Pseudomonadota bacterium]
MSISNRLQKAQHKLTPFRRTSLTVAIAGVLASGFIISSAYAADSKEITPDSKPADEAAVEKPSDETAAKPAATATDENQLGNVVVTANKREESAQKVATAITVLDGKELQDKGIGRTAGEVLNYVPNASANTQNNGRPRWWIRGVGAGQQQIDFPSPVGLYLDDVYISNATATGFPIFDLDHVEVLRGPQGTLWGKNTTGGAINIISKK